MQRTKRSVDLQGLLQPARKLLSQLQQEVVNLQVTSHAQGEGGFEDLLEVPRAQREDSF